MVFCVPSETLELTLILYVKILFPCRLRFPGFEMRVVCFDPILQDQEGCSAASVADEVRSKRRKRQNPTTKHSKHLKVSLLQSF